MVKGEYSSNRDTTRYSEKTLKGKLTPKEEIRGLNAPISAFSGKNSEGKPRK
jgi:hypothetical protein